MSDLEIPQMLPECELLSAFSEDERKALTGYGSFGAYAKGDTVIAEDRPQNALHLLVAGKLKAMHHTVRGEVPLGSIAAGEWFGEINMLDPQVASARVIAQSDAVTWAMDRTRLEDFLNEHPSLGCQLLLGVGEILARRTRAVTDKLNATWEISW